MNNEDGSFVFYHSPTEQKARMERITNTCNLTTAQDWFETQVRCNWPNFQVPKEQIKEYQNYWNEVAVARRLEGK